MSRMMDIGPRGNKRPPQIQEPLGDNGLVKPDKTEAPAPIARVSTSSPEPPTSESTMAGGSVPAQLPKHERPAIGDDDSPQIKTVPLVPVLTIIGIVIVIGIVYLLVFV